MALQARTSGQAGSQGEDEMRVTIAKRGGVEEVHAAGCRDLANNRAGKYRSDRDDWTAEFGTLEDLYASYWDCIADESVANGDYPTLRHAYYAWQGEFDVKPCASALTGMQDPDADSEPEGSKGEDSKMDAATYKAHRTSVMRNADAMRECLAAHGQEMPVKKTEQIKLHDSVCKPDADAAPQADEKQDADADAAPQADEKPAARTRTRKAAPKPAQDEPCGYKAFGKTCIGVRGHDGKHQLRGNNVPVAEPEPERKPQLSDITVPYPAYETRGKNLVAKCPECGRTFIEKVDSVGEQTTHNYETHYAQEHKAQKDEPKPASRRGRKAAPAQETKPATRGRKAPAKAAPAKPAQRSTKPAKGTKPATRTSAKPAPVPAAANGTKPHAHKQELAREVVNLVASHFASASDADKERISYWLRNLPVGNPDMPGNVGGHLRYWPATLPRPVGIGWYAPAE